MAESIAPAPDAHTDGPARPTYQDMDAAHQVNEMGAGNLCCPSCPSCCLSSMFPCMWCSGCTTLNATSNLVLLNWGKYWGTIREPGCYCWNPCGFQAITVDVKRNTVDLKDVKIGDASGNPLIVSGVVTYKVHNPRKVALEVENAHHFVINQGLAVLKSVVSHYPYEAPEGEVKKPSLRTSGEIVRTSLINQLQERCIAAGLHVINFELTDLAYAPEIAKAMLVRQQAEALVGARKLIVTGAVSIATDALTQLEAKGVRMDQAQQSQLISNLLVVICGDSGAQPTVSLN